MNSRDLFIRVLMVIAVVAGTIGFQGGEVGAATDKRQCVVDVVGVDAEGFFVLSKEQCYDTFAEVVSRSGRVAVSQSLSPTTVSASTLSTAGIIGTHYDGANSTGASYSVSGSNCSGGGLNVPLSWNDRFSSTVNGCPHIAHYEHTNYGGASSHTYGAGGNISGYMDNRTSAIRYYAS